MVKVIVCCPFFPEKKLSEQFSAETTVALLKRHLAETYINDRSVLNSIRLIFAGKLLDDDHSTLEGILNASNDAVLTRDNNGNATQNDIVMTIHLVYKQPQKQPPFLLPKTTVDSVQSKTDIPERTQTIPVRAQPSPALTSNYLVLVHGRPYLLQVPVSSSFIPHSQHAMVFPPSPLHPLMSPLATTHGFLFPNNMSTNEWPLGAISPFLNFGNHQNTQSTDIHRHTVIDPQQPPQTHPEPVVQQPPIVAAPVANIQQPQQPIRPDVPPAPQNPGNFVFNAGPGGGLALAAGAQDVDDEGRAINRPPNPYMLLFKLSFLLYLFTQRTSYERTLMLTVSAIAIFVFQMGYVQTFYSVMKRAFSALYHSTERPTQSTRESTLQQQQNSFIRNFLNILFCFVTSMLPNTEAVDV